MATSTTFDVRWLAEAERLLRKRDHYTEEAIRTEFEHNPEKEGAIEIDKQKHLYVTPVADERFVVLWDLVTLPDRKIANVRAVLPTQLISDKPDQIRDQIREVVEHESKGAVKLD